MVDPGYVKLKMYDATAKMESLRVCPISRTAAKQRAGRAGGDHITLKPYGPMGLGAAVTIIW